MTVNELIEQLSSMHEDIDFDSVIRTIDENYHYTPTRFHNGKDPHGVTNEAGSNEGSCKILAFGKLNNLGKEQALACFGKYYREDVLGHPDNDDHANIRSFMRDGWEGIRFDGEALRPKP